jgi:N-acetylglutamate synthase-like GNAT family acetyltransferase
MVTVEHVTSESDSEELDCLLWEILWKPIGFPREIRKSFEIGGTTLEIVARNNSSIVGGLVAVWTSAHEVEIRHIAVTDNRQKTGVGKKLINSLLETVTAQGCSRIHTVARNTSTGFFEKVGLTKIPGATLEHPAFAKHGIYFNPMEKATEPGVPPDRQ